MEPNQEQRRVNGHASKNSAKGQEKGINGSTGFEGSGRTGYGLREKPKKSWKFSRSEPSTSRQEIVCEICGSGFGSLKALSGHLRHHSGRQRSRIRCNECSKVFQSLKALISHKRIHSEGPDLCNGSWTSSSEKMEMDRLSNNESLGLVRKKRSNKLSRKIRSSCSFSRLDGSVSPEKEEEDVAISLIMLSRGPTNWDAFNMVAESSDNDSMTFKAIVDGNEEGTFACEVLESFKIKKPKLEVRVDDFYRDAESMMPRLEATSGDEIENGNKNEMKIKPFGLESDHDSIDDNGLDRANSGSLRPGSRKTATSSNSEIVSKTFNKNFHSHQAARGQQSIHRTKNCYELRSQNSQEIRRRNIFSMHELNEVSPASFESKETKKYKCNICFKVFSSGQALGGHKRAHSIRNSEPIVERNLELKQEISEISDLVEKGGDLDVGFKAWWVGNDQKHEVMAL